MPPGRRATRSRRPGRDLVIATGRQSVAPALAVKRATRGRAFLVQIQNPRIAPRHFDLVITPRHDRLAGDNVLTTLGALHGVTLGAGLDREAAHLAPRLADLPRPRVAVLIGGTNDVFRLSPTLMGRPGGSSFSDLCRRDGAGLMVTPSRRTGEDNLKILQARLAGLQAEIWDGSGPNPYFGYLGLADHVVVTGDSVNMVSEAAATGVPVHVRATGGRVGEVRPVPCVDARGGHRPSIRRPPGELVLHTAARYRNRGRRDRTPLRRAPGQAGLRTLSAGRCCESLASRAWLTCVVRQDCDRPGS